MKYWQRWIGDYQRDTGHLSLAEHGAYALMLDVHYATERPLPRDRVAIHRLLRAFTPAEQAAVDAVLDQFWAQTDDGWINPRAARMIEVAQANRERWRTRQRRHRAKDDPDDVTRDKGGDGPRDKGGDGPRDKGGDEGRDKGGDEGRDTPRDLACARDHTPDTRLKTSRLQTPDILIPDISSNPNIEVNHTLSRSPQKNRGEPRPGSSAATVRRVFEVWREVMGHPRARLDDKRRRLIRRAFELGYDTEDLELAIHGCAATPHNMGVNDRGTRYDDLGLILRDGDHIDRFMRNARQPPKPPTGADRRLAANVAAAHEAMRMDDAEPGAA